MFGFLLDTPDEDTAETNRDSGVSRLDMYMTVYPKQRQRAYDRARRMVRNPNHHKDVEDAKAEAAMIRAEAQISRARGVHHIIERSKGGDHSPDNLTTLCWWHHHVAVHRQGMRIDPQSPPRRRRLLSTHHLPPPYPRHTPNPTPTPTAPHPDH